MEVALCPAIKKKKAKCLPGFSLTRFFMRTFTRHYEKFQMLVCGLVGDGPNLNGFQMLLKFATL